LAQGFRKTLAVGSFEAAGVSGFAALPGFALANDAFFRDRFYQEFVGL
jgi:hypothetical protein